MTVAARTRAIAPIFLVTAFGVALSAPPALAQKSGGSITVGLELDIPGFDPLKIQADADVIKTAYPLPLRFAPGDPAAPPCYNSGTPPAPPGAP